MTKMRCIYCGAVFDLADISKPIMNNGKSMLDFVWISDNCPRCKKGMDDWYEGVRE